MTSDFGTGFRSIAEGMRVEREERLAKAQRIVPWGIKFLDDATGGIWPHDLVLVGARTGRGKTALLTLVADTVARAGKRVHLFALEAEPSELELRKKFRDIARRSNQKGLRFRDWCRGAYEGWTRAIEEEVIEEAQTKNRHLYVFYRTRSFTVDDLEAKILAIQGETDLIIIDHLHYIDTDDADDNHAQRRLAKRLRDVALAVGKPVIAAAHLRKSDRRSGFVLPDLDDFHGSSDLTKIATKVLILGPAYGHEPKLPWLRPTFLHIAKDRMEGGVTYYVARLDFDARTNRYLDDYVVGQLTDRDTKWEIFGEGALPEWLQCQPLSQWSLAL